MAELGLILLAAVAYLLWRILRVVSAETGSRSGVPDTQIRGLITSPASATETDEEPYVVDNDPWEDGSSHIDLYPSQQRFIHKSWWVPGDREEEYDYSVSRSDCRVMYRLRAAKEMGTKSGDAPFEERFYDDLYTVKDGVVLEEAVRFIHEDNRFTSMAEVLARLTAMTEWHELTAQSDWPELWYRIVKIHIGEYDARHGLRKELERLKRGMKIVKEQTSRRLTIVHHEKWGYSEFKPVDESSSQELVATILSEALALSGISLNEAQGAHFRIKRLSAVLGDTKEETETPPQTA